MDYEFYTKSNNFDFNEIFNKYNCNPDFLKVVKDIRNTAANIHASVNQYYDGSKPYIYHLDMVVDQFMHLYNMAFSHFEANKLDENILLMLIFAAYFHDTIEDCRIHYNDVTKYASRFLGKKYVEHAADIVFALTEEKGKTREDRHSYKYYGGIANTAYASCIKTADMCANMIYSWYKSESRYLKYYREWNHCKMKMLDDTGIEFSHRFFRAAQEYIDFIPALYPTLNKKELLLSKEDMKNICNIRSDNESGGHLIRKRADEYLQLFYDTMKILSNTKDDKTEREKQITEFFNACGEPRLFYLFCGKYGLNDGKEEYEKYYLQE
ncbi:MAG: hypothetical protein IKO36_01065 [Bacteroidaceae bacterium]|nr:hypothetical protein [Bacteroidaceae bacterium]